MSDSRPIGLSVLTSLMMYRLISDQQQQKQQNITQVVFTINKYTSVHIYKKVVFAAYMSTNTSSGQVEIAHDSDRPRQVTVSVHWLQF